MPNTIEILSVMYINFRRKEMHKDYISNRNVSKNQLFAFRNLLK